MKILKTLLLVPKGEHQFLETNPVDLLFFAHFLYVFPSKELALVTAITTTWRDKADYRYE